MFIVSFTVVIEIKFKMIYASLFVLVFIQICKVVTMTKLTYLYLYAYAEKSERVLIIYVSCLSTYNS